MLHKILKNRKIWAAALLMVLLALGVAQAAGVQPQKSTLTGKVVSTESVGPLVTEGTDWVTAAGKWFPWKFLPAAKSQQTR